MIDRVDIAEMLSELQEKGYYQVKEILTPGEITAIKVEIPMNNEANYTPENLASNAVYPSMKSDTRESHAHMYIEEGQESVLPHVKIKGIVLKDMMRFHDDVLSQLLGYEIPRNNRKMVNWQMYSQNHVGASKFLRRHRDGNYCSYELTDEKAFRVKEALYNRYILGFNVENDNTGEVQGTSFYDTKTGKEIHPTHEKGSFIIFDNIRLEHFVKPLDKPRIFVGMRSFDVDPFHFVGNKAFIGSDISLESMESLDSPGYGRFVTTEQATKRLLHFYKNEWPSELEKIMKEDPVF